MKANLAAFVILSSVFVASCSTTPAASPNRAAFLKESHDLTHMLVDKDATFQNSIQQMLPAGVYRLSPSEFSKLAVRSGSGALVPAGQFIVGKATSQEVMGALVAPARISDSRDGHFVYSYDASDGSIVTYLFARGGLLEASYGYHVTVH